MKPEQGKIRNPDRQEATALPAASAIHELNNLLTLVLGYSQLIVDGTGRADPNRHNAEQVLKAGERAAILSRRMADEIARAGNRSAPLAAAAGHGICEKNLPPVPAASARPSRRAARRV